MCSYVTQSRSAEISSYFLFQNSQLCLVMSGRCGRHKSPERITEPLWKSSRLWVRVRFHFLVIQTAAADDDDAPGKLQIKSKTVSFKSVFQLQTKTSVVSLCWELWSGFFQTRLASVSQKRNIKHDKRRPAGV